MEDVKLLVLCGTKQKIVHNLSIQLNLNLEECIKVFDYIEQNIKILSGQENFERFWPEQRGIGYVTPGFEYYINIKTTTVILLLFLLDSYIPNNLASLFIMLTGINTKTVVRLREGTAEKCILKEILHTRKKQGTKNILKPFKGECCNNQYPCLYRREGRCKCSTEQVEEIMDYFTDNKMLKKKGETYQYLF